MPAGAALSCTGVFANPDGGTVEVQADGSATMSFRGNTSTCKAKALGGSKLLLDCGGAFTQEGAFAGDCSSVAFGGMAFGVKK